MAPADALGHVTQELPGLDPAASAAFALVALVGRPRPELPDAPDADAAAGLSPEELAEALARARKALRRKLHPLPGSGWCERAERLISDRFDDALEDPGPARLEVHLANCDRCVEHERRLGHAQDALVAGFEKAHPAEPPANEAAPTEPDAEPPPALRVVDEPQPALPPAEAVALPAPDETAGELPPSAADSTAGGLPPAEHAHTPVPPAATPVSAPEARPPAPPAPAPVLPAPSAPAPAAHPTVPAPKPPPPPMAPAAPHWPSAPRYVPPAAQLEMRPSRGPIQESEWTAIGPLLAVLFAAVSACLIALLLAL